MKLVIEAAMEIVICIAAILKDLILRLARFQKTKSMVNS